MTNAYLRRLLAAIGLVRTSCDDWRSKRPRDRAQHHAPARAQCSTPAYARPGKEFALIVPPGLDVAAPAGWSALAIERVRVDAR